MCLKKTAGPRLVKLLDGSVMTRDDLPDTDTQRWVASRKAAVVNAVRHGLIHAEEAAERYSDEELAHWMEAWEIHGENALKATRIQHFRRR
ncbi:DUF1153 domain-containing protein [Citreimonas salinaria]|uniref:CtrA inhibitor SciP n=1 Tax=Citreimonas salinaria TaxID=321339 RepID=UPI000B7CF23B|nr:DUF1153 domain-containing protein [Citreimonas salinaria]